MKLIFIFLSLFLYVCEGSYSIRILGQGTGTEVATKYVIGCYLDQYLASTNDLRTCPDLYFHSSSTNCAYYTPSGYPTFYGCINPNITFLRGVVMTVWVSGGVPGQSGAVYFKRIIDYSTTTGNIVPADGLLTISAGASSGFVLIQPSITENGPMYACSSQICMNVNFIDPCHGHGTVTDVTQYICSCDNYYYGSVCQFSGYIYLSI